MYQETNPSLHFKIYIVIVLSCIASKSGFANDKYLKSNIRNFPIPMTLLFCYTVHLAMYIFNVKVWSM